MTGNHNLMHVHTIQLNIEKLIGGTVHMDAVEFGAYMSLIVAAYQCRNKLPNDDKKLARMARVTGHKWGKIKDVVLVKFTLNGDFYEQNFIKEDLIRMESLSKKNKDNRLKGLNNKKPVVNQTTDQNATNTNTKEQITIKNYNKNDFDRFFKIYPKQVDPHEAEEAFKQQVEEEGEDPEIIIEAARQYAAEQDGNEKKFIKNPATFLDKKVFLSPEYQRPAPKPVDLSSFTEWQKRLVDDIGLAATQSWFIGAELNGKTLTVETKFKQDWIKTHYPQSLKLIGVTDVQVKKA